jgi:hypothetical protein
MKRIVVLIVVASMAMALGFGVGAILAMQEINRLEAQISKLEAERAKAKGFQLALLDVALKCEGQLRSSRRGLDLMSPEMRQIRAMEDAAIAQREIASAIRRQTETLEREQREREWAELMRNLQEPKR